jgi:serine/threonine-protein kinase
MPVPEIQRILWEAACALGHAHYRGVVHRDVKPANIMFDHDGKVMLTDFGISKALQQATGLTGTGMIIGTPHYMAPEQAKGQQVDGRADQYALGVVGYRMITGMLPFSGDSVHTILYKHIFEEAPRTSQARAGIPLFLSDAIARALAKEPDQRFATMEDFATAVWPEQPVAAPRGGRGGAPTTRARRKVGVTSESPTEAVASAAPTTPMPVARRRPLPPPRRGRRNRKPGCSWRSPGWPRSGSAATSSSVGANPSLRRRLPNRLPNSPRPLPSRRPRPGRRRNRPRRPRL